MKIVVLFIFFIFIVAFPLLYNVKEGFTYKLENAIGNVSDPQLLVQDTYPATGRQELSKKSAKDVWWLYPVFTLGSYKQITNNIRYPRNPDNGTCSPISMCDVLYENKYLGNNTVSPLKPLTYADGKTRVGYFHATPF